MSYILDALNKAEKERTIGSVPDLAVEHGGSEQSSNSGLWIGINVLVLAAIAAAVAWFYLKQGEPTPPVAANVETIASAPAPAVQAAPEPKPEPQQPPQAIRLPEPPKRIPPKAEVQPLSALMPTPPAAKPAAAAKTPSAPAATPAPKTTKPAPTPQAQPQTADWSDVPALYAMSLAFQQSLPKISIDAHVFSGQQGRSFAIIEGRKIRSGELLDNGIAVLDIVPDGLIGEYQGERFHLLLE